MKITIAFVGMVALLVAAVWANLLIVANVKPAAANPQAVEYPHINEAFVAEFDRNTAMYQPCAETDRRACEDLTVGSPVVSAQPPEHTPMTLTAARIYIVAQAVADDEESARLMRGLLATFPKVGWTPYEIQNIAKDAEYLDSRGMLFEETIRRLGAIRVWEATASDDQARGELLRQWVDPHDAAEALGLRWGYVDAECERLLGDH